MTVVEADLEALDPDLERDDLPALVYRRVTGRHQVDEWGLDRDLVAAVVPLARLRWSVRAEGDQHIPEIGPALLVHTRRLGISEPAAVGMAVRRVTGRPLRVAGVPSRGPLAWSGRRLGGVPSNVDDLRSLLRAGELVALGLGRELLHPYHAPPVPVPPVEVALALGVPILPVAVVGMEPARRWVVRVGQPLVTRRRAATGDPTELAEATRARLQRLLTGARRG
ncbi:MAG TPA: hypothetical protein VMT43_04225 [Acidimicrobiales bacterium]|nr:hypothetical protein [Acidimicrobiales bacterium]